MIIGLFTSRYILHNLGVDGYGIYSVVGSIIVFFSFFDGSFASACLRFYNVEKGKGNINSLQTVFSTSVTLLIILALLMALLAESFGLYFIDNELKIDLERLDAAKCVFHCSVITMIVNMISIPFTALIIANEKMGFYAYLDIFLSVMKFLSAFLLPFIDFDSLILYSLLILISQVLYQLISCIYCFFRFPETILCFDINLSIAKQMGSFSLWVILNAISSILVFQGLSILYNIYFGVVVNAALGIANQVKSCSLKLTQNLTVSLNPQLTQNYAKGDINKVNALFVIGSKLIYSLFSIITLLLFVYTQSILDFWLTDVPKYSVGFVRILLFNCLMGFVGGMSGTVINANGDIKKYQLVNAFISYFALFLSYLSFIMSTDVYLPYIIISASSLIQSIYNIYLACEVVGLSFYNYIKSFIRLIVANIVVVILGLLSLNCNLGKMAFVNSIIMLFLLISIEFFFGYETIERNYIIRLLKSLLTKSKELRHCT